MKQQKYLYHDIKSIHETDIGEQSGAEHGCGAETEDEKRIPMALWIIAWDDLVAVMVGGDHLCGFWREMIWLLQW